MVTPDEFSQAWRNIQSRELFELDINDYALMIGWVPEGTLEDEHEIFQRVLTSSLAHRFLKAAWDYRELWYVVTINGFPIGFRTPFGWSFLTDNSYAVGHMPTGWRQLKEQGENLLRQLLTETQDADYTENQDDDD